MSYSILTRQIAVRNTRLTVDQYVDEIAVLAEKAALYISEGDTMAEAIKSVVSDSYLVDGLSMTHGIHAHSAYTDCFILKYNDQVVARAEQFGHDQTDMVCAMSLLGLDVRAYINI